MRAPRERRLGELKFVEERARERVRVLGALYAMNGGDDDGTHDNAYANAYNSKLLIIFLYAGLSKVRNYS